MYPNSTQYLNRTAAIGASLPATAAAPSYQQAVQPGPGAPHFPYTMAHPPTTTLPGPPAEPSVAPPAVPRRRGRPPANPTSQTAPRPRKRARAQAPTLANEAGAGPSSAAPNNLPASLEIAEQAASSVPPTYTASSSSKPATATIPATTYGGTDVWALVIGTNHAEEPVDTIKASHNLAATNHMKVAPEALKRPSEKSFSRLLCVPCLLIHNKWHTWANAAGGSSSSPRTHLQKEHPHKYAGSCGRIRYYKAYDNEIKPDDVVDEDISKEGLARYLAEFVAEQDLAFNVVQAPALRRLLCYVGQNNITMSQIPERRAVAKAAAELSESQKKRIATEMQNAEGRISITSDLWSDEMGRSFMSVTGHYERKRGLEKEEDELVVRLLAFRAVEIGSITLDNASNNDTMMRDLECRVREAGYVFDRHGSRIRCFPHVVNLAVQSIIDTLEVSAEAYRAERIAKGKTPSAGSEEYLKSLKKQVIKRCRASVVALRYDQRKRALNTTIKEGNERQSWKRWEDVEAEVPNDDGSTSKTVERVLVPFTMKALEPLLDCRTRWSSTRNMIERYIYLYPAISHYIWQNQSLAEYALSQQDFQVLQDICSVLNIAHEAQELLSSEQTPTLSLAFPVYENLMCRWHEAKSKYPALAFAINTGIEKIGEYVNESRSSPIHILAMFLNPCVKYTHIDKHWSPTERNKAREVVKDYMMKYAQARDRDAQTAMSKAGIEDLATRASSSLGRGIDSIMFREGTQFQAANPDYALGVTPPSSPVASRTTSTAPFATPSRISTLLSTVSYDSPSRIASRHLESTVLLEHDRYLTSPALKFEQLGKVDLVKYWNMQTSFPLLCALSKDVLPAQASSVSSERIFSSSKRTCTRARNKISVQTVEMLQILKHSLRHSPSKNNAAPVHTIPGLEGLHPDEYSSSQTLDIMVRLADRDWSHDAILDDDLLV